MTHERWSQALLDRCQVEGPTNGETAACTTGAVSFLDGGPPELTASRDTLALNAGAETLFGGGAG